ncbi:hypothetical protein ACM0L0_02310 [Mycoplasma sp. 005V]|uniref:hypothetical protein n=1 Tax=Mycoplasma sp. 005V TaxID=3398776 RepID=UPI003A8A3DB2
MTLLEKYKIKVDELPSYDFNYDQKELVKKILEKAEEKDLQNIYQFLIQRVKVGFKFDYAPESNSKQVVLLQKDDTLSFKNDPLSKNQNILIIGENYDALKNLLVLERERERLRD